MNSSSTLHVSKNNLTEKWKALKLVISSVEKQFGKGSIMQLGEEHEPEPVAVTSTGSLSLDLATGCFGLPKGRMIEIYGPESSGKTTLALHAIAEAQKASGVCAFIDAEHALDVRYAKNIGVEIENLLVSQPDHGEEALDITEALVRSGAVDLIVIDSVAALTPKAEIEGEMGDSHMGLQARLMSQALRKLAAIAHRTETTLLFINQLRQKIGVTFGSTETTTGGNALKFYASMRFDVRRIGQIKVGEDIVGGRTRVKIAKNKLSPPFTDAEFEIRYGIGIDKWTDLLDLGLEKGLIEKNGNHMSFAGTTLGNGRERSRETLLQSPELSKLLKESIISSSNSVGLSLPLSA